MEDRSLEWYHARYKHDIGAITKLLDKEYLDYCKYLPRKSAPNALVITVVLVSWTLIGMAFYTYRKATHIEPMCTQVPTLCSQSSTGGDTVGTTW